MTLGLLIPVFNDVPYLPELLARVAAVWQGRGERLVVCVVDDGSRPPLGELSEARLEMVRLHHPENRGKGAALRTGFTYFLDHSDANAVITMDADLQHLPEKLPAFAETFAAGAGDLLIGYRRRQPGVMPFHRILSNSLTSLTISLMVGQLVRDSQCGFRLYSRKVLQEVRHQEDRFHFESEFVIRAGWRGFKIGHVAVPTIYNGAPSAIRNWPDTLNFIEVITRLARERISGHV
ncbi:MAG: glycosyltransferase family 2 protein [Calditrichaeota bacterium]|nr:glycosyltransferase family 2 protein [Calditrichota bacterium]